MPRLVVMGRDAPLEAALNASLLDTVLAHGVPIHTSCGGVAACGLCRLTVLDGAHLLTRVNRKELEHLGDATTQRGLRLACQARFVAEGTVRVEIPPVPDVAQRKQDKMTRMLRQRREERQLREQQRRETPRQPARPQRPRGPRGRGRG